MSPERRTNTEALVREIASQVGDRGYYVLSIDGVPGCGKTFAAREIATALGARHLSLDELWDRDDNYAEHINCELVHRECAQAQQAESRSSLRAFALADVMFRAGITPSVSIYLKVVRWGSGEADVALLHLELSEEDAIAEARRVGRPPLYETVIRYHHRARPHEKADFILEVPPQDCR